MINRLRNQDENLTPTAIVGAEGWSAFNRVPARLLSSNRFWICRLSVLIAVVTFLFCGCDAESAKWDLAKSRNLYQSNDLDGCIELLESAHQKAPQDNVVKLELAKRYAENGQGALGIGLCNEYLKQYPEDFDGYRVRADCWPYLGRFDEALADYKRSLMEHVSRDASDLNGLAYHRALANKELARATDEIQEAIERVEVALAGRGVGITLAVQTLVAAGLVSRHIEQRESSLRMLNQWIESYEKKLALTTEVLKTRVTGLLFYQDQLSKDEENKLLELRINLQRQTESLAAMLVIRALLYEDLGQTQKADQDRWAVKELDFDFEKFSNRFPTDLNCLRVLSNASSFLDTRGFVLGRQRWVTDDFQEIPLTVEGASRQLRFSSYKEAVANLDLSILAADFVHLGLESQLCNSTEIPTGRVVFSQPEYYTQRRKESHTISYVEQWKKDNKRKRAVLLHHRREIHLRGGNQAAAALDQESIDELGIKESHLF